MPLYQYTAISNTGEGMQGSYTAKSRSELLAMIREKQYYPVTIKETVVGKDIKATGLFSRVGLKDLSVYCRQFHAMLQAGVTVIQCLDILKQQTENKKLKETITQMYDEVQKGSTFSETTRNHKDVFPEILVNMIEAGEMSGKLDYVMEKLAVNFEKENKIMNKVKGTMVYPIILSIVTVCVVV